MKKLALLTAVCFCFICSNAMAQKTQDHQVVPMIKPDKIKIFVNKYYASPGFKSYEKSVSFEPSQRGKFETMSFKQTAIIGDPPGTTYITYNPFNTGR